MVIPFRTSLSQQPSAKRHSVRVTAKSGTRCVALLGIGSQPRPAAVRLAQRRSVGPQNVANAGEHRLAIGNNAAATAFFTVLLYWRNVTRAIPISPATRPTKDLFSGSIMAIQIHRIRKLCHCLAYWREQE